MNTDCGFMHKIFSFSTEYLFYDLNFHFRSKQGDIPYSYLICFEQNSVVCWALKNIMYPHLIFK